jgi:hypothetical protein
MKFSCFKRQVSIFHLSMRRCRVEAKRGRLLVQQLDAAIDWGRGLGGLIFRGTITNEIPADSFMDVNSAADTVNLEAIRLKRVGNLPCRKTGTPCLSF